MPIIPTILFDLDGTLLDTAPDLGFALNTVLAANDLLPLSMDCIRPAASHGTKGLLELGFGITELDPDYLRLKQAFLDAYQRNIAASTTLFPGVAAIIHFLQKKQLTWGIVTNKPSYLTTALLEKISFPAPPHCVVSGDTVDRAKPFPDPLLHACKQLNCMPQHCIYVGDAERDIQAGKAAGMKTVLARYGYLAPQDKPEAWLADAMIESMEELALLLTSEFVTR